MIRTPIRAPNANAYAKRWVETLRAECLDWLLILGPRHLDRALRTCVDHYNAERPHRGIELRAPKTPAPVTLVKEVPAVRRREILGGLINEYSRAA
ncbi:MAG: transposase [Gemmatimonadota bacterium]|nr:transposase [Gemmatimonadota bacterium]